MTPSRPPFRRSRTLALAAAALAALGACAATGSSADAPDRSTTEVAAVPPPPAPEIRYQDDVLTIDGVAFRQFPAYEPSKLFEPPPSWFADSSITIEAIEDRSKHPIVAAVSFVQDSPMSSNPPALIDIAEKTLGVYDAPILAEGSTSGTEVTCLHRVKHGAIHADGTTSASGVVITEVSGRARVGVHIDGYSPEPVQRLTLEIAEALCAGR